MLGVAGEDRRLTPVSRRRSRDACNGGTAPITYALVAGWRDDLVDHGLPDRDDDVHGHGDGRRPAHGRPASSTITVNPALSCTVSPAAKTIDSGQSVTIADACTAVPRRHVRVDAGRRTTSSITVTPTVTTTYTVTATDAAGATRPRPRDDHGEPGAVVHGLGDEDDD